MDYIPSCAKERQFLNDFDASKYQNPAVAADIALFALDGNALKILLIRRANYPFKNRWALPGGFVGINEDIQDCAHRELFEETGILGVYLEQAFTFGRPGRDPRQRVISVNYTGIADISALCAKAGDDAAETEWFTFSDYTIKDDNDCVTAVYTLSGHETLRPVVSYPKGRIQQITGVGSAGLAADHAELIAYSYEYIKMRVQNGLLDLAFADESLKKSAKTLFV
ncbi:MAG: NUDIX hydrolase [Christensenellales bacterium]